jgi:hypothetical protein
VSVLQQCGIAVTHQQFAPIDQCRLQAAYSGGTVGFGQRCCWPLNADAMGDRIVTKNIQLALFVFIIAGCALPTEPHTREQVWRQ